MPFLDPEELKPKLKEIFENVVIPQIKRANMKQTALEWLMQELKNIDITHKELFEKALEMEKEIIRTAYLDGMYGEYNTSEQYYNETFKSE